MLLYRQGEMNIRLSVSISLAVVQVIAFNTLPIFRFVAWNDYNLSNWMNLVTYSFSLQSGMIKFSDFPRQLIEPRELNFTLKSDLSFGSILNLLVISCLTIVSFKEAF